MIESSGNNNNDMFKIIEYAGYVDVKVGSCDLVDCDVTASIICDHSKFLNCDENLILTHTSLNNLMVQENKVILKCAAQIYLSIAHGAKRCVILKMISFSIHFSPESTEFITPDENNLTLRNLRNWYFLHSVKGIRAHSLEKMA